MIYFSACSTFPRAVTDDVVIDGYIIPKGTVVYGSLRSAHHDDGCWDEPMKFYPRRFLDENGNIKNQELAMPFSLGNITINFKLKLVLQLVPYNDIIYLCSVINKHYMTSLKEH